MYMRISWKGQKRNPHSSGDYADANRTDGSSRYFAGFGFFGFYFRVAWESNGGDRISTELIPVAVVKMFSSSAATGLLLDIYKTHGADSMLGRAASVMLSSTETIFYTMSVYFMSVKVKKTRYTLPGALFATTAGIVASVFLVWKT